MVLFSKECGERSSAWLERQPVDLEVAGSNPVAHPNPIGMFKLPIYGSFLFA